MSLPTVDALKRQGNASFAQRDYASAMELYTQALDAADANEANNGSVHKVRLYLQLYANRALAALRLGQWAAAAADGERAASQVLCLEELGGGVLAPEDRGLVYKALYRWGVALCMLGDVASGAACVARLQRLEGGGSSSSVFPGDGEAVRLLEREFAVLKVQQEGLGRRCGHGAVVVRRLVALLWKDVLGDDVSDGDGECDVGEDVQDDDDGSAIEEDCEPVVMLERLAEVLQDCSRDDRQRLFDCIYVVSSPRLLLYLISTPSTCRAACRVLAATAPVGIVWPRGVWSFLAACACGKKKEGVTEDIAGACMGVLLEVARRDAFAKEWLLGRCWEATGLDGLDGLEGTTIARLVSDMVGSCHLWTRRVGSEAVAAGCGVLACAGHGRADVVMPMLCAFENAWEIVWGGRDGIEGGVSGEEVRVGRSGEEGRDREDGDLDDDDEEAVAKRALIRKQRAVYDPRTLDLRKAIVEHLKAVFASKSAVTSELVEWKGGRQVASQVHHRLVALGKTLVGRCPKRSTKVYDGLLNVVSYEKRPYAADYNDNPAGDFLATIDLEGLASAAGRDLSASPLLNEFLQAIVVLLDHKITFVASLMTKAGAMALCESLAAFVSPSTVALAQRMCARMLIDARDAKESNESRESLMASSNVVLLAGLADEAHGPELCVFALGELARTVPSCSGNDLKYLIDKDSKLLEFLKEALEKATGKVAGGRDGGVAPAGAAPVAAVAVRLTGELAKRTVACGSARVLLTGNKIPKGHGWGCFDAELLETVMYTPARVLAAVDAWAESRAPELGVGLSRGFLPKALAVTDGTIDQSTPDSKETTPSSARREVLDGDDANGGNDDSDGNPEAAQEKTRSPTTAASSSAPSAPPSAPPAPSVPTAESGLDHDDDDCPVFEVYDSTPASEIRAARAAWMALDRAEKITWEQTSSDVVAKIRVPKGTSAKDVAVSCTSTTIAVDLKWYGKVLNGDLFGGIKAHEFTWCLNDDSEVYVVLPKDSKERWWKTLIQGWEEKGYYELLKDAVDADEPHVAYDDMDEGAKDLLDSMLERQAYINAGMLDLENGFDDFRIVLSDNSLGESS